MKCQRAALAGGAGLREGVLQETVALLDAGRMSGRSVASLLSQIHTGRAQRLREVSRQQQLDLSTRTPHLTAATGAAVADSTHHSKHDAYTQFGTVHLRCPLPLHLIIAFCQVSKHPLVGDATSLASHFDEKK